MRQLSPKSNRFQKPMRAAILIAGTLLLAGCSRTLLTAPELDPESTHASPAPATQVVIPPPPSLLSMGSLPAADSLLNWVQVTQVLVAKDAQMLVTGHRYDLDFEKGSLPDDEVITIKDYDPNVLDVQFGPHG